MNYFYGINDLNSLTLVYRRLAMLNHPDMGGNAETMKRINVEYDELKNKFSGKAKQEAQFEINELVRVNKSIGRVSHIGEHIIIIRSETTNRNLIFSRESGQCLSNPKYELHKLNPIDYVGK